MICNIWVSALFLASRSSSVIDGEIAEAALTGARQLKLLVIFGAIEFDLFIGKQFPNGEIAVNPKTVDLIGGKGFEVFWASGARAVACMIMVPSST